MSEPLDDTTQTVGDGLLAAGVRVSHHQIVKLIGSGGMGHVYQGIDESLNRPVAIKLLSPDRVTDANRVQRFIQEARAASALNHPNIVTIHEHGKCRYGHYLVMELVEGRSLSARIKEGIPFHEVTELASQLSKAFAAAHAAGIVHRDIKPENIHVREDGYVKVLDFGLARLTSSELDDKITGAGMIMGTLRYMSPEQSRGESAGASSDIFSLGIVFYEMFTGHHPFQADSAIGTLQAIATIPATPPSLANPEISDDIDALILSMLEKAPNARPSARDVMDALQKFQTSGSPAQGKRITVLPASSRKIVGREMERATLNDAFEAAAAGSGKLVCVSGEAGMGKSTLIEDFLSGLAFNGQPCHIGRGRCSERLAGGEAYLPLLEALGSLLHSDRTGSVARTMKQVAPTWYTQVASQTTIQIEPEARASSLERMKHELLVLLQALTRNKPLILFFDDLHWADISTIDIAAYLISKFDQMGVLLIATFRESEMLLSKHPFLGVRLDAQSRGMCQEISLEGLNQTAVENLLAMEYPGNRFPSDLAARIHARTEGHPLFTADLVRYLGVRKAALQENGYWVLSPGFSEIESELPESVRSMVQRKIDAIREEDRRLLVAASVQGFVFDTAVVSKVLELDPADVEENLEKLERVHSLVRLVEEREMPNRTLSCSYRFVHSMYQKAFYATLRPTRRASLSGAIAQALSDFHGSRTSEIATDLAALFEAARNFTQAAHYYLLAAQDAISLFAHREAAMLARRGVNQIRMSPEGPERDRMEFRLQLTLGNCLALTAGYTDREVLECFTRAQILTRAAGDEAAFFQAVWGLWMNCVAAANCTGAFELANQLLRMSENSDESLLAVSSHYALALTNEMAGNFAESQKQAAMVSAVAEPGTNRSRMSRLVIDPVRSVTGVHIRILWFLGYPDQARRMVEELLVRVRTEKHDPRTLCDALISATVFYGYCGQIAEVLKTAQEVIETCDRYGLLAERQWGIIGHGWARTWDGSAEDGIAEMRASIDFLSSIGVAMFVDAMYTAWLAERLLAAGHIEEAGNRIERALEFSSRTGHRIVDAELHRLRGRVLQRSGASAEIVESSLRRAIEIAREQQARSFELRATVSLGRFLHGQGRTAEARAELSEIHSWFSEGFDTTDLIEARTILKEWS